MFRTLATTALVALSFTAAQAGEVRFGDLNLASPVDAATLKGRIAIAAAQTCATKLDFGVSARIITETRQEEKACIARVSARTLARIEVQASQAAATRLARR